MSTQAAHTILVVEDEPSMRRMLCVALEQKGLHALSAGNGVEALEQLASHPVDLILTDWNMPRMNGAELTTRLQEPSGRANPPVIVLSCEAHPDEDAMKQKGIDAWLRKPCRISEIQKTILEIISMAKQRNPGRLTPCP